VTPSVIADNLPSTYRVQRICVTNKLIGDTVVATYEDRGETFLSHVDFPAQASTTGGGLGRRHGLRGKSSLCSKQVRSSSFARAKDPAFIAIQTYPPESFWDIRDAARSTHRSGNGVQSGGLDRSSGEKANRHRQKRHATRSIRISC
jgi:hypothetical protein